MARRWAWWIGSGLLLVVLLAFGTWRLLQEIPGLMAKAEDTIREETEALGLRVSYRDLRFHLLHFRVSLEDLDILDGIAGVPLARAEHVDVSLSPWRILSGRSPVSRVLVRKFSIHAGEGNRPLVEGLRTSGKGEGGGTVPEIVLLDGEVLIGPLGPLVKWGAKVPMVRIRPTRFRGTHVTAEIVRSAGRISLPGAGRGNIPFDRAEAEFFLKGDLFRIKRLRVSGASAKFILSGKWDGKERAVDLKWSGETDIAGWTASGAPGGDLLHPVATEGTVSFSARITGSLDNPQGSGKILARNLLLTGNTPADAEVSLAVSGNKVLLKSIRGKVWDGVVSGVGAYDWKTGVGDTRISLERAAFGKAPWDSWGIPWRPTGRGDLVLSLAGGKEKVQATVSLKNPGGFERPKDGGGKAAKVAIPVAVTAAGVFAPGRELLVRELRATVGGAEATGAGVYTTEGGRLAFTGTFLVPRGRAAEYGWVYPVSWGNIACEWTVSGTADNPLVTAGVRAEELAARDLPPVPLSAKLEGNPADVVHFVADIPSDVAKVTATGTLTGPLSPKPALLVSAVDARDIDFSLAERWGAAVLSSLGKDPAILGKHVSGMSGKGTADLQLSAGEGTFSLSGTIMSPEIRFPGISAQTVSASGNWFASSLGSRWGFRGSGKIGEGEFLLAGKGEGAETKITGTMEDMNLETVASFVDRESRTGIGGIASLRVTAGTGPQGWEIETFSASVPRLSARGLTIEGVSAEGSLGGSSGTFSLLSASPDVRVLATVRREKGWPVSFSVKAAGVPTGTLLDAIGRGDTPAGGTWDVNAEGVMKGEEMLEGKEVRADAFSEFRVSLSASSPSYSGISFDALHAEGKREGDVLTGKVDTRVPDSHLSYSLSLREPFSFQVEGPFSMGRTAGTLGGEDDPGASGISTPSGGNGKAHFSIAGGLKISGSLLALEDSRGTLGVQHILYRTGDIDMTGEDISVVLSSEGIRWASGNILAAGNPLRVSGKSSWAGDLDLRLGGTVPAGAIRLATDVFDRLEGIVRMELRVTGKWDDPSVIGTGHLENGTFSFREYAQLFEKMSADAVISREGIIIEHFEGRSGGGYIDGRGEIPLRFAEGQKMFLSVDFFDMRYPYPAALHPVLQGHVELIGPPRDVLITGDVEIQSATYTKDVRPEKALLDFRSRIADVTARGGDEFRMRLDLETVADGTIHVRNNLAVAEIGGEFKIVGDTSRVILLGAFDVTEGHVDFRGSRYELTRGSLEFQDPRRNNPRIDFQAETKKGNVSIIVSVSGTLEKYEVELSSDPPYSKNDVVSLLSLGVTSEGFAEGGGEGPAAEAAAIALIPITGGVTEGIRTGIGLDKFAIEPSFSVRENAFEPRFIVGKTFGDRFSVSVSTTVGTTQRGSANVEYRVLENVYLEGNWESSTLEQEGDLGADVKFRYRYRQFRDVFRGDD